MRTEFTLDTLFSHERLEERYYALSVPHTDENIWVLVIPRTGLWIADDEEIAKVLGVKRVEYHMRLINEFGGILGTDLKMKYPSIKMLNFGVYFDDHSKAIRAVREWLQPGHLAAHMAGAIRETEQ